MVEVISTSLDISKETNCPDHAPARPCRKKACRFWEFCRACDNEAGEDT